MTAAIADRLTPYVDSGFVHLDAWGNDTPAQVQAFDRCFHRFRDTHDWVAFFDADEYLMLLERCVLSGIWDLFPEKRLHHRDTTLSCADLLSVILLPLHVFVAPCFASCSPPRPGMRHAVPKLSTVNAACSGTTLSSLLEQYNEYPALAVNWVIFGPNGRARRPPGGGVLRWYTQCNPTPNAHIKVIANSRHVDTVISPHPHNVYYKCELQMFLCSC